MLVPKSVRHSFNISFGPLTIVRGTKFDLGVQTPEDGRTQFGHSAVGAAADLMTSPSQLVLTSF